MDRTAVPEALIRVLAATPPRFEAAVGRVSETRVNHSPDPGGWSPNEILWHVRAAADVYGEHTVRILNEDSPRWRHVSARARMKKARYDQMPFAESLTAFVEQRTQLLGLLEGVAPADWQRYAIVRMGERESRLTLHKRVWGMANHEDIHCAQVDAIARGEADRQ